MPAAATTLDALRSRFGELPTSEFRGDTRVVVGKERLGEVMEFLKESAGFDLLVDVTCVDYLNYRGATDRFGLVYLLANTITSERIEPSAFVGEVVMKQEQTPFLAAAAARGCRTQVGTDMLFEQIPAYLDFFGFPSTTPDELRRLARVTY